jgi:hypothetical protein
VSGESFDAELTKLRAMFEETLDFTPAEQRKEVDRHHLVRWFIALFWLANLILIGVITWMN